MSVVEVTDEHRTAALKVCPVITFRHECRPVTCWSCDRIARALAERDATAIDIGRGDAFLAAEQGMKDAEAAEYKPQDVTRFMLDSISARLGAAPVARKL